MSVGQNYEYTMLECTKNGVCWGIFSIFFQNMTFDYKTLCGNMALQKNV